MPADASILSEPAPGGPYKDGFAVTASDTVDFNKICNALWVGTAHTALVVVMQSGAAINFGSVPAGTLLKVRAKRVNATTTSPGTGILGLI